MNISLGFLKPVSGAVKKYKALVPPVVITVVAAVLCLLTLKIGGDINEGMEKSVRSASSAQSLLRDIPSRQKVEHVRVRMDELQKQVDAIKNLVQQSTLRTLITYKYKIFPEPDDQSQQVYVGFGEQYRTLIEKLIGSMNALDAPSDVEIRANTGGTRTAAGHGGHRPARATTVDDPRIDALCIKRAQEVTVYANPTAFVWYPFWDSYEFSGKSQALEDCWNSQVAYWIYEDVVDTIKKMNGDKQNVLTAPVKRLLGVRFSGPVTAGQDSGRGYSRSMAGSGIRDKLNYVSLRSRSLFVSDSPTARLCSDDVDIVHFAVSVLVDNRSILPFMKELCSEKPHVFYPDFEQSGQPVEGRHNQITILQSDLSIIDKRDAAHELYRYGKSAVARVDLVCEYQLSRAGYDKIKPDVIKEQLGQPTDTEESEEGGQQSDPDGMGLF